MKIYLSGSRSDLPRVQLNMTLLRERGHTITLDWTVGMEIVSTDAELSVVQRRSIMRAELAAIGECEVFWLLIPPAPSWGCLIEYGYALRCHDGGVGAIDNLIVSGNTSSSLFFDAARGFANDGLVFDWLRGREGHRQ